MEDNKIQQKNIVAETISALLVSKTITDAAELLGLDRSTLYKRMEMHPEIKATLDEIATQSLNLLKSSSFRAAEVLIEMLNNPFKRLEAAKEILDRVGISGKNTPTIQNVDIGGPMKIEFVNESDQELNEK